MAGRIEDSLGRDGSVSSDTLVSRPEIILKETTFDGITYVAPTADQMDEYAHRLGLSILESGIQIDRIIPLARGGLSWSVYIMDALKIPHISMIRTKGYEDFEVSRKPKMSQKLKDKIKNETVLIFDEVAQTGDALELAESHVEKRKPKKIYKAVLCYKPTSRVVPDFWAFQTSPWVFFPHETRENVVKAAGRWTNPIKGIEGVEDREPLSYDQIIERLVTIGLAEYKIRPFLDIWWEEHES